MPLVACVWVPRHRSLDPFSLGGAFENSDAISINPSPPVHVLILLLSRILSTIAITPNTKPCLENSSVARLFTLLHRNFEIQHFLIQLSFLSLSERLSKMFGFSSEPVQKIPVEEIDKTFSGNSIGTSSVIILPLFLHAPVFLSLLRLPSFLNYANHPFLFRSTTPTRSRRPHHPTTHKPMT